MSCLVDPSFALEPAIDYSDKLQHYVDSVYDKAAQQTLLNLDPSPIGSLDKGQIMKLIGERLSSNANDDSVTRRILFYLIAVLDGEDSLECTRAIIEGIEDREVRIYAAAAASPQCATDESILIHKLCLALGSVDGDGDFLKACLISIGKFGKAVPANCIEKIEEQMKLANYDVSVRTEAYLAIFVIRGFVESIHSIGDLDRTQSEAFLIAVQKWGWQNVGTLHRVREDVTRWSSTNLKNAQPDTRKAALFLLSLLIQRTEDPGSDESISNQRLRSMVVSVRDAPLDAEMEALLDQFIEFVQADGTTQPLPKGNQD